MTYGICTLIIWKNTVLILLSEVSFTKEPLRTVPITMSSGLVTCGNLKSKAMHQMLYSKSCKMRLGPEAELVEQSFISRFSKLFVSTLLGKYTYQLHTQVLTLHMKILYSRLKN